ncbi:MAG: tRNA (guanosine(37)-N1)-methyltransferase TrmD [Treponema sp.]|uniref:tRNA (guanosine(37)-N1)-methyltransferase TrmD n=1 Tax=Treponema sp. TaxID=166 RepID=UPI001DFC417E|nr:tRNA (guanosine(37)-N1)-methyltransferase TrmD [Treponema sp.]MCI5696765.1 tRNA (guanosine(37)-N1)-methyltransferase TrmD [Spirochaetia bacterium]MBS7309750.1 tRNA (guanosine(37)-N1)-methyltransferase TrmD [Treponema sp.]MCQ2600719.1 tRNA (guanosine(37)-N1)-methyltransferase TrmD [Treponema sp.]MDD5812072.1 tRNA (guanosine(37)-N1)-methyltransferase TrmD [Treponema sp.]MDY5884685.1 tRNA (guanosine(37)-N1)-methyltransferase TrmD [Treponema sp.]
MKFTVLTLFPQIPQAFFENSIMAKAVEKGIIAYDLVNIRDFATDKHHTCDDSPYGGGAGQLMMTEPLGRALDSVKASRKHVIYVTPSGKQFTQSKALELSRKDELVIVCGRYEGIDQRIIDYYVDDEISIGDYVMSSGEVSATVIIDTVYRLIDGVISSESLDEESYSDGLLEYPQYTRPPVYKDMEVPDVLLSGNHEKIRKWRLKKRLEKTLANRPDLIAQARLKGQLTSEAEQMIEEITNQAGVKLSLKKRKRKSK